MKKKCKIIKTFLILALLTIFISGYSQEDVASTSTTPIALVYGLHAGGNVSTFYGQPHTSFIPGLTGGIHARYGFNSSISVQAELNYVEQGGRLLKITNPDQLGSFPLFDNQVDDQTIKIYEIEFPLLFAYDFHLSNATIRLLIGPSVAYTFYTGSNTETTAQFPGSVLYATFSSNENLTKSIEPFQYNASGGLAFEFPFLSDKSITFDFRYRYSINAIYPAYSYLGIAAASSDLHAYGVSATIGINF